MAIIIPTGQPAPIQPGDFQGAKKPNKVKIAIDEVAPPSSLYIQRDDVLGVLGLSGNSGELVTISGRFLRADDGIIVPFLFQFGLGNLLTYTSQSISLGEGYLLSVTAECSTTQKRGLCFVECFLIRGALSITPIAGLHQILFRGYLTRNMVNGWPNGVCEDPDSGYGAEAVVGSTTPGAGVEWGTVVNASQPTLVTHIECTLTTSATVANRIPAFKCGGTAISLVTASAVVPASTTAKYMLDPGVPAYTDAAGVFHLPLPQYTQPGTFSFGSVTTALQAGDQWSAITVHGVQWLRLI